jgi:hypothetical protein
MSKENTVSVSKNTNGQITKYVTASKTTKAILNQKKIIAKNDIIKSTTVGLLKRYDFLQTIPSSG